MRDIAWEMDHPQPSFMQRQAEQVWRENGGGLDITVHVQRDWLLAGVDADDAATEDRVTMVVLEALQQAVPATVVTLTIDPMMSARMLWVEITPERDRFAEPIRARLLRVAVEARAQATAPPAGDDPGPA